jgi:putative tryptophan/tyrosine transport system substrate-binding protein
MRRREFVTLLATAAALPLAARAQKGVPVIAILGSGAAQAASSKMQMSLLDLGMRDVGLTEGRDYVFDIRWAGSDASQFSALAGELLANNPRAVVVSTNNAAFAVQKLSRTVPIVGTGLNTPVAVGLVTSLARPGGNITGLSVQLPDTAGKRVELLREVFPRLRRLAIFGNSANPVVALEVEAAQTAAQALRLDVVRSEFRRSEEISSAIEALGGRAEALYVCVDPLVIANRTRIYKLALAAGLPVVHSYRDDMEAGALISYGPDILDLYRRAAGLVDKILRGAKPADIPVEQPTKFELAVNLNTAKTLGLEISPSLLARADEVIE